MKQLFLILFISLTTSIQLTHAMEWRIVNSAGNTMASGEYAIQNPRGESVRDVTIKVLSDAKIAFDYSGDEDMFRYIANKLWFFCFQVKTIMPYFPHRNLSSYPHITAKRDDLTGLELPSQVLLRDWDILEWVHCDVWEYEL